MWRIAVAVGCLTLLASCGGGSGGSGQAPRPPEPPPDAPVGEQLVRAAGIIQRAVRNPPGALFEIGRIRGERIARELPGGPPLDPNVGLPPPMDPVDLPDPARFSYEVACETEINQCNTVFAAPGEDSGSPSAAAGTLGGVPSRYTIRHAQWVTPNSQLVLVDEASGIGIVESRSVNALGSAHDPVVRSWGAWLDHSGFAVLGARTVIPSDDLEFTTGWRYALLVGDLTGTRPERIRETGQGVVWEGAMVGTTAGGLSLLTGQARITYFLDTQLLDAAFTGLPGSYDSVVFRGVPVDLSGRFQQGVGGNYIRGGFFGPDHAETAGVFEQANIIGAFGAFRQETGQ